MTSLGVPSGRPAGPDLGGWLNQCTNQAVRDGICTAARQNSARASAEYAPRTARHASTSRTNATATDDVSAGAAKTTGETTATDDGSNGQDAS